MPNECTFDTNLQLIVSRFYGKVTQSDIVDCGRKVLEIYQATGAAEVLSDCREIKEQPAIHEIFAAVHMFEEMGLGRVLGEAMWVKAGYEFSEGTVFYKNVCVNRGYAVEVFSDYHRALDWLTLRRARRMNTAEK